MIRNIFIGNFQASGSSCFCFKYFFTCLELESPLRDHKLKKKSTEFRYLFTLFFWTPPLLREFPLLGTSSSVYVISDSALLPWFND